MLQTVQVANLVNGVVQAVDIPRPQTTPAEPAYAENTDHVTKLPAIREFEAGNVHIELPTLFVAADVFLRRVEIRKLLPTAQKAVPGAADALYPTGAATDSEFVRDAYNSGGLNELATDGDEVLELLGGELGAVSSKTFPALTLRAGEFVRLTLFNNSGADIDTGDRVIRAMYKMGLNEVDTGRR
jgi:hypothetical protein